MRTLQANDNNLFGVQHVVSMYDSTNLVFQRRSGGSR